MAHPSLRRPAAAQATLPSVAPGAPPPSAPAPPPSAVPAAAPALGGALCACTFHFFYNPPELYPIVAVQAGLTLVGNVTLAAGAFVVWNATRAPDKEKKEG